MQEGYAFEGAQGGWRKEKLVLNKSPEMQE